MRNAASGHPTNSAGTPITKRSSAMSNGPLTAPAAMSRTASGTGTSSNGVGMRNGKRSSSPYASAFPAASATGGASASAVASTDHPIASDALALEVDHTVTMVVSVAAGAATRSSVSPQGRGASSATRPAAQTAQSKTPATIFGAVDQCWSASVNAFPVVIGSTAQVRRAHQSRTFCIAARCVIGCMFPTPSRARAHVRSRVSRTVRDPSVYYEFHAYDRPFERTSAST
jgi:hypothetical protein